tara:strand:+ start:165 stop:482 length:318 start_codon:yes stop_codon:yes gene_type:complete
MKVIEFEGNTQYMRYEYHRVREGPNYFVSYYKHSSRLHYDPKEAWRTLGVAKFTDTGKALKEWCLEMDNIYVTKINEEMGRVDTSFASEVQSENEEPNDNTKMVT